MDKIEAQKLPSASREAVWRALFEVDKLALTLGVEQGDLGITNYILRNEDDLDSPNLNPQIS